MMRLPFVFMQAACNSFTLSIYLYLFPFVSKIMNTCLRTSHTQKNSPLIQLQLSFRYPFLQVIPTCCCLLLSSSRTKGWNLSKSFITNSLECPSISTYKMFDLSKLRLDQKKGILYLGPKLKSSSVYRILALCCVEFSKYIENSSLGGAGINSIENRSSCSEMTTLNK